MKRMPFERPTDHYDERLHSIDEQLCDLIKQRKEISNNNPGFPPLEYIANWAKKFEIYEDLLRSIFGLLWRDEQFRYFPEPDGFKKYLPVLKSFEKDDRIFTVTFIRQYNNSSIVTLNIDWDASNDPPDDRPPRSFIELDLGQPYNCRTNGGSGTTGHQSYDFIVFPPLPDDISGLDLVFRERHNHLKNNPTGLEIAFHLD